MSDVFRLLLSHGHTIVTWFYMMAVVLWLLCQQSDVVNPAQSLQQGYIVKWHSVTTLLFHLLTNTEKKKLLRISLSFMVSFKTSLQIIEPPVCLFVQYSKSGTVLCRAWYCWFCGNMMSWSIVDLGTTLSGKYYCNKY